MSKPISVARPLVLGSGSPRRREILENLRIPFVVASAAADETVSPGEAPSAYLERVVLGKLAAVRARLAEASGTGASNGGPERWILVADTSVIDGATILGKPGGRDEGVAMLARLAGRTHAVMTRFALAPSSQGAPVHAETVTTQVTFRALSSEEIEAYVASGEGTDKAGGYAVQGFGASFVARIDGSYANVVGLPACELFVALAQHGLVVPGSSPAV